jgi:hypothetical protein
LQNLVLQRRTQSFHASDAVLARCFFQLRERREPEFLVKLQHLLRTQSGDVHHLHHAGRNLLAHGLECRVRARAMQFFDDTADCLAHSGNFLQPILRNELC